MIEKRNVYYRRPKETVLTHSPPRNTDPATLPVPGLRDPASLHAAFHFDDLAAAYQAGLKDGEREAAERRDIVERGIEPRPVVIDRRMERGRDLFTGPDSRYIDGSC